MVEQHGLYYWGQLITDQLMVVHGCEVKSLLYSMYIVIAHKVLLHSSKMSKIMLKNGQMVKNKIKKRHTVHCKQ